MNDSISEDQQDHVFFEIFLHLLTYSHGFSEQRSEKSWSAERKIGQGLTITLHNPLELEQVGIFLRAINRETVMNFPSCIKSRQADFSPKSKSRDKFISIIIQDNIAYLVKRLLIVAFLYWSYIVQRIRLALYAITCGKINTYNHSHLHPTR